ncbi:MAG: hypothetical protein PVG66_16475 [Chromatiales bacterium]|jgi:hypothetical protein
MNISLKCILAPPLVAARYTCGTSCIAPVCVIWLAAFVSILFGFIGGPTGQAGISWQSILFGLMLWCISGCWTFVATRGTESCGLTRKNKHSG